MTIQELRELRAKAWDDAREFLDSKRNDSGLLSEEDRHQRIQTNNITSAISDNLCIGIAVNQQMAHQCFTEYK